MKKALLALVKVGLSVAILAFLVVKAHRNDAFSQLRDQPKDWTMLALALACCAGAVMLTIVRWHALVRAVGIPLTLREAFRLGLVAFLFNLAPMGIVGGDALKAWMLARQNHGRLAAAASTVVVDRVIGLYVLFCVASVGILLTGFWRIQGDHILAICISIWTIVGIATLVLSALMIPWVTHGPIMRLLDRMPRVGRVFHQVAEAVDMYRRNGRILALGLILSVGVHSLFSIGAFLIATALYRDVPALAYHFVLSPISSAGGILPLPLGPYEGILDYLYPHAPMANGTVTPGIGLVVALGYRIIILLVAAVGMVYYIASRREFIEVLEEAGHEREEDDEDMLDPPESSPFVQDTDDRPYIRRASA